MNDSLCYHTLICKQNLKRKLNGQIRKGFVQDINIWRCVKPKFASAFAHKKIERTNKIRVYIGVNLQRESSYNRLENNGKEIEK